LILGIPEQFSVKKHSSLALQKERLNSPNSVTIAAKGKSISKKKIAKLLINIILIKAQDRNHL